jgi:outer membrane protein OmpA-like peptidoglycan-associated protein
MKYIFFFVFLLITVTGRAQEYSSDSRRAIRHFETASEYFSNRDDAEAEAYLLKATAADEQFIEAWFMLAQIALDRNDGEKAAEYYSRGLFIDPDRNARGFLKLSEIEFGNGNYSASADHLDRWKTYGFDDERSKPLVAMLERNLSFALRAVNNPVPFDPEPLGKAVNTDQYEYWPSLSIDEQTIFFTVLGPPNPDLPPQRLQMQEDFYYAQWEDGEWVGRTYLGAPVNTNTNEGAQTVTADGRTIYFTGCNRDDGHGRMCDIYSSSINENGHWSEPVNLGDVINTSFSEKHPSISSDDRFLIFASNRSGGEGGYDLWISEKSGDTWSVPVNMGDSINTPGTEQSPFIHPDQKTLYFSSDGWPGLGRGDIFLSRRKADGSWSSPVNLGYPVNTHNEEVGFIVNARGDRAYYSSNRRDGTDTDIYTFEMPYEVRPRPVSYITGRVYDSRNMKGVMATLRLFDIETGQLVTESVSDPGEGDYILSLPTGSNYAFNVSHPGYLFYSDHFKLEKHYGKLNPLKKEIPLDPVSTGKMIVLNNIFYATDSYKLKKSSTVELDKILEFMELNQGVGVEISGHTDNTGTAAYNQELSLKRAEEVVRYLTSRGIDQDRMTARGYGDTMPVADNTTEEGRAKNRRTTLKILRVSN